MDIINNKKLYYMKVKPFQCGKCWNRFITQDKLKFHAELVHSKGLHYCAKCDFTSTSIGKITWHNQTHIREKHYNAFGKTNLITNDHSKKSDEKDQFNIQVHNSDKEDYSVSCNQSFQIENAYNKWKQAKINSHAEIENQGHGNTLSSSNNDLIGIENRDLEARNISNYVLTNSDFVDDIKAFGNHNNTNIEIDGEQIDKDFILEANSSENVNHMISKTYTFEPMSLFIDLINENDEKRVKCSESHSQRETKRKHKYTQSYIEEQIPHNTTSQATLLHKENNIDNNLVKPACSKINQNNYTGTTDEVEKLMLQVQAIHGQFQCPECKKMFKSSGLIKGHLLIHTGEKRFQYTKCYSAFNQNIKLQRHMKKIHNEGLFKCIHCDETFVKQIHLSRHNIEIHYKAYGTTNFIPNNDFKKSVENEQFNIQGYDLDKEDQTLTYNGSFQVKDAHKKLKEAKINSHIEMKKQSHENTVSSSNNDLIEIENINFDARNISNFVITNSDFIDKKMDKNEEVEYIKASGYTNNKQIEINGEATDKDFILESNSIEIVDDIVRKTYNFEPMSSFIDIINEKSETWVKCSAEDSQRETERKHIYTQNNTEEKITPNNKIQAISLHKEDNIHNNLVKPVCSKINQNTYTGITNEVKKLMLKVQTIDGRFQCPECKKLYKSSGLVKRHLLIHTGENPFQCTKCSSAFNQNIKLQRHMKKIHNEGLFKCIHCDENFVQQIHLSRHIMEHAGIAPFSCNICQKMFLLVRDVRKHMRYEHEHNKIESDKTSKPNIAIISDLKTKNDITINKVNDKNKCTVKEKRQKHNNKSNKIKNKSNKICESQSSPYDIQNPDISCEVMIRDQDMEGIEVNSKYGPLSLNKSQNAHASSVSQNIYKCIYCKETFKNNVAFKSHIEYHEIDSDSDFSLPDLSK